MTVNNVCIHFRNNIERIRNTRLLIRTCVVTIGWSLALKSRTSPSTGVELGSPLANCSESINSVHTVNNCTCMSVHFYNIMPTFVK